MTKEKDQEDKLGLFDSDSKISIIRESNASENKTRASSIRKMLRNHNRKKTTNYKLLINHIIIIQNDIGVSKTVSALKSFMDTEEEIRSLETLFEFLSYIDSDEIKERDLHLLIKLKQDLFDAN